MSGAGLAEAFYQRAAGEHEVEFSLVRSGVEVAASSFSQDQELGDWEVVDEVSGHRSWLVRGSTRVEFIKPLPFQLPPILSPADVKLLREGRRASKTRKAWRMAFAGHGPEGEWSRSNEVLTETWTGPKHRGILSGKDVVWIARDHIQARVVWLEEVKPKFSGKPGVYVNNQEKYLTLEGHGSLYVRSAENMDSIRGIGANLVGAIVDEAAHFDLKYLLDEVLRYTLLDNEGWLVLMSTTNAGKDGNKERPAGPSYFNLLCTREIASKGLREKLGREPTEEEAEDIPDGYLDGSWEQFHATARDNPFINDAAFAKLQREIGDNAFAWAQEGEAKLLKGLYGLMFTKWRDSLHIRKVDPSVIWDWAWRACLDWGFSSPGWFGVGAFGPHEREHLHREYVFNGHSDPMANLPPFEVGKNVGLLLQKAEHPMPDQIVADEAMWATGDGRGGRRISDAEKFRDGLRSVLGDSAPELVKSAKGPGSRVTRVKLFMQSIRFTEVEMEQEDGTTKLVVPSWGLPKFTSHPRCKVFNTYTPALPVDPKDADDVDTTAYDHPFDGWTYLTQSRPYHTSINRTVKSQHKSPGLSKYLEKKADAHEPHWAGVEG